MPVAPGLFAFLLFLVLGAGTAAAHSYRFGALEIFHPVIMVPSAQLDCSCAHVSITNHGSRSEYLIGATIAAAQRTHLIEFDPGGSGLVMPSRVEIRPGQSLELRHPNWCLFMSGISTKLEPDTGTIRGELQFEEQGQVDVEFMIESAQP